MKNKTLVVVTSTALLLGVCADTSWARRSRRRTPNPSERYGGSAKRGAAHGEALAQSFYERAVLLGKQGQFGQAKSLMTNVVRKNPSNDKYRYYLALLLYKNGDFGAAEKETKILKNGSLERYRRKALGLQARIDAALTGDTPLIQPMRPGFQGYTHSSGENYARMDYQNSHVNVADMAGRIRSGQIQSVSPRLEPSMTPSTYRSVYGRGGPTPMQPISPMDPRAVRSPVRQAPSVPDPLTANRGWVDPGTVTLTPPPSVPVAPPVFVEPTRSAAKPKPPKPVRTAKVNKPVKKTPPRKIVAAEPTTEPENPFTSDGGEDDVWDDVPVASPPAPAPAPSKAPAPPAPPSKAPEPVDDGFGDGFGDDGGFGEIIDEADGGATETPTPEASKPAPAAADESGDDGFGDGFGDEFGDGF